ncbi:MAG: hypothetical protein ACI3XF_01110 [Eubacteriales bacterium]
MSPDTIIKMFPDKFAIFSHPALLILLAAMVIMFILEFIFRRKFFMIANAAFAAFAVILGIYLEISLAEVLILALFALVLRLALTLWRGKHDV